MELEQRKQLSTLLEQFVTKQAVPEAFSEYPLPHCAQKFGVTHKVQNGIAAVQLGLAPT